MTVLKVEDMHCEKCVERITKAMKNAQIQVSVSLPEKEVTIQGTENRVEEAKEILDDLGFTLEG